MEESAAEGDRELIQLARLVAPLARTEIGDSLLAAKIWYGAASRISDPELRAECEIASADTSVNDLVNQKAARTLLAAAASHLGRNTGPLASRLRKVQGDFYALTGDGERARQAYREAEAALGPGRSYAERTAWRGAHARSTEQFLKTGELPRACRQIHAWESQFPADRIDGYLTLLYARYWAARQLYDQAVALAQQLENVNPDSPYVDQILLLAAECELARGNVPRARATLQSILTHYPGSPLVPDVRAKIEALPADAPNASPTRSD